MNKQVHLTSGIRSLRSCAIALLVWVAMPSHAQDTHESPPSAESSNPEGLGEEIDRLQAENARLVEQLRREIDSLGGRLPPEKPNESKSLRARRAKYLRAKAMLTEIQQRLDEDAADQTLFYPPRTPDPDLQLYYDRLRERIEDEGTLHFPKDGDRSLYGEVVLAMVVLATGELKSIEVKRSTSDELARHSTSLVHRMAPFEPFPAALSQRARKIFIATRLKYSNE